MAKLPIKSYVNLGDKPDWLPDFNQLERQYFMGNSPMMQMPSDGSNQFRRAADYVLDNTKPGGSLFFEEMPSEKAENDYSPYFGAASTGLGLLANAYNTANSYTENTFESEPVKVPTSQQGLARLSEMERLPYRNGYDYGRQDLFRCGGKLGHKYGHGGGYWPEALGSGLAGASAGMVFGPIGAVVGGVVGLGSSILGNEIRNSHANHEADLYNAERREQEANRAYALGLGARQIGNNMTGFFRRNYVYDNGGSLGSQMDGGNGVHEIISGGSHERNPLGGVPMGMAPDGMPNLVEEGEVKWDKENYIFSKRLKPTQKILKEFVLTNSKWEGKSYAEIAKAIQGISEERENDPTARQTVDEMLGRLMDAQETTRMEKQAKEIQKMVASMSPEELNQLMASAPMGMQQGMPPMPPQTMPMQMAPQGMEAAGVGLGQEPVMGEPLQESTEQPMMAYGGHLFDDGGKKEDYDLTEEEALEDYRRLRWLSDNQNDPRYEKYANLWLNSSYRDRINFEMPKEYYEWLNDPSLKKMDFNRGGWGYESGKDWRLNLDPGWVQARYAMMKDGVKANEANHSIVAKYMRKTEAYKKGTEWLKKSEDNMLRYLNEVLNSEAPEKAKKWARKFVDNNGKWKDNVPHSYNDIFSKREDDYPGTYWKTPQWILDEIAAEQLPVAATPVEDPRTGVRYYIRNGNNYELIGPQDVYNNWVMSHAQYSSPYQFRTADEDGVKYTDYYVQAPDAPAEKIPFPEYSPWPGIANAGVALMGAWNRPDYEKANIIDTFRPEPVDYTPIGNYLPYDPMDIDYMTNVLRGQSAGTRAAINNRISPSVGAEQLAADFNAALALGNAYEQARQNNQKERQLVAEFNRGTDQFNAGAANQAELTNFGLNGLNWDRTRAYADARDAASTLASQANSAAVTSAMQNLNEAYKDWYNTEGLGWLVQNNVYPGVEYRKKKV